MAPVVRALKAYPGKIEVRVCVTGQHREMLDQVLGLFDLVPDVDLDVMQANQGLADLTARTLARVAVVLAQEGPDWVLVQGDTTSAMATALAASYRRIPVGHVEAGLRTHDRYSPFPEEINRRVIGTLATVHFAPTAAAVRNLLAEGVARGDIALTGNTIVDAVKWIADQPPSPEAQELMASLGTMALSEQVGPRPSKKLVLVTAHRRESFGPPLESLCRGLRAIADQNEDVLLVYPVHFNPNVQSPVRRLLAGHPRIRLIDPLAYEPFVKLMSAAYLVLTDSGGIQEEAAVLGKPLLVLRDVTERPEIIETGIGRLVGTDATVIAAEANRLLHDTTMRKSMARKADLYGDGHAAERIVSGLLERAQG